MPMAKRPHDFIAWLLWAVSLLVPLFKYVTSVVTSGSFTLQVSLVLIVLLGE